MTEISALKEVLIHAIEAQKESPSKTLDKTIRYMKRWMVKLHKEKWRSEKGDNLNVAVPEVYNSQQTG